MVYASSRRTPNAPPIVESLLVSNGGLGQRFWLLWGSFTSANLGDGLSVVGFPLLAISLTDDARLVAFVAMCRFLAFPLLGLPAGIVIDRFERRKLAAIAQMGRASALGAVTWVVMIDEATIPIISAAAFVVGVGEVITDGGLPAVVRSVVRADQLEVANSRLAASQTASNAFIGPPLGALLFEIDPALPFLVAAGLYLLTVGMLGALRGSFRAEAQVDDGSLRHRMTRGLAYVWGHPVLRPLALVVAAFSFVGQAGHAIFVILVTERIGLSNFHYGLLLTVDAMASLTMSFFVARLITRTSHGTSMRLSVVTFTASALLLGFTATVGTAVLAMFLVGLSDPTWNVISATVRQRLVPDAIFGRMMTAYLFIAWGIQPFGALAGGFVAESLGPEWVYVLAGALIASLMIPGRRLFREVNLAMAPGN